MKLAKIIPLALLLVFTATGMALAAGTIKMGTSTTVSASVQNKTSTTSKAAVTLRAYNQAGTQIASLCKKDVYLPKNSTTKVTYTWTAPKYATGVYWNSKVNLKNYCDTYTYHADDDDHDDHDDDEGDD
jgi:hypothetical protein